MSEAWLKSLPLGAIILAPYQNYTEELRVVRAYKPNYRRVSVLIKRPHLKQLLPMTPVNDDYVQYQFSSHAGNTHHDFRRWTVIFPPDKVEA